MCRGAYKSTSTVGAKSLERSGKITHERPKKDFSLKLYYLFKKYSSSSYFSKEKSKKFNAVFSIKCRKKLLLFFKLYKCQSHFFEVRASIILPTFLNMSHIGVGIWSTEKHNLQKVKLKQNKTEV
jgi:hypothetical protein